MKNLIFYLMLMMLITTNCNPKKHADLIISNAKIYTVNESFDLMESLAVKDGKILEIGKQNEIIAKYETDKIIDLKGAYVYPGFIDAHCHFYGYAENLQWINLKNTQSFEEIIEKLIEYHNKNKLNWILGRGWDQNDWDVKEFPDNTKLNELFPENPVVLTRIDGHAVLANQAALKIVGFTHQTNIPGGKIKLDNDRLTGILLDKAADIMKEAIPKPENIAMENLILKAQQNCFEVGLTTICDAGLELHEVNLLKQMEEKGELKIRDYVMLNPTEENFKTFVYQGPSKTDIININSIKVYIDGALGSRGARLIEPYSDDKNNYGILVTPAKVLDTICSIAFRYNYQVNTHAIGDGGVRIVLDTYAKHLKNKNDLRWRIEHSQIVHPDDIHKYGKYNIIPSVQTTHATSDMYWADERLGKDRLKTAYAYKELLNENGWIPNGSDFPVEDINPLLGFYAAVARRDVQSFPEGGFQVENALSRKEALKAMTIWAARANFEENEKGSLEKNKFADFVVLDEDLMKIELSKIPAIKVKATFYNGELVYNR